MFRAKEVTTEMMCIYDKVVTTTPAEIISIKKTIRNTISMGFMLFAKDLNKNTEVNISMWYEYHNSKKLLKVTYRETHRDMQGDRGFRKDLEIEDELVIQVGNNIEVSMNLIHTKILQTIEKRINEGVQFKVIGNDENLVRHQVRSLVLLFENHKKRGYEIDSNIDFTYGLKMTNFRTKEYKLDLTKQIIRLRTEDRKILNADNFEELMEILK